MSAETVDALKDILLVLITLAGWLISFSRAWTRRETRIDSLEKLVSGLSRTLTEIKEEIESLTVQFATIEERVEWLTPETTRRSATVRRRRKARTTR